MRKIEAIIRQEKLDDLLHELNRHQIYGITATQVLGAGKQKGQVIKYRGTDLNINLLPKYKIELIVKDSWVEEIVEVIQKICKTGSVGDGKIFIYDIQQAVRIRTGEKDERAIN